MAETYLINCRTAILPKWYPCCALLQTLNVSHWKHLQSLVIKQCTTIEFLSRIRAPSLQRLSIIQGFPFSFEPLVSFIDRSNCKLKALGIATHTPFGVEGLQSLLSKSESITRLYIGNSKASDYQAMMRKIPRMLDPDLSVDDGKEGVLLPNLQVLYYTTIDPVRSEDMISMIKHRWGGNHQISEGDVQSRVAKLRIVRFKKSNLKLLFDPLKEEMKQGLEVTYDLPYKGEPFE
ncbi:hypothetical protein CPB84DRAFT_1748275 [Gymnopilus junonius]|uniref:Uncharacterized protein n=1 Tax=Gymnopilus junonius TaxID=109634 RepID=A0A9P5NIN9_GYMJU|nr:hypothetical protein CPB84DRAFT_1748275 [Gymnopilus junonius]